MMSGNDVTLEEGGFKQCRCDHGATEDNAIHVPAEAEAGADLRGTDVAQDAERKRTEGEQHIRRPGAGPGARSVTFDEDAVEGARERTATSAARSSLGRREMERRKRVEAEAAAEAKKRQEEQARTEMERRRKEAAAAVAEAAAAVRPEGSTASARRAAGGSAAGAAAGCSRT